MRDVDLGRPEAETINVNVKTDDVIVDALIEVTSRLDDHSQELKKIRRGHEIALEEEIDEVD